MNSAGGVQASVELGSVLLNVVTPHVDTPSQQYTLSFGLRILCPVAV